MRRNFPPVFFHDLGVLVCRAVAGRERSSIGEVRLSYAKSHALNVASGATDALAESGAAEAAAARLRVNGTIFRRVVVPSSGVASPERG